jgi:hypothetical protein
MLTSTKGPTNLIGEGSFQSQCCYLSISSNLRFKARNFFFSSTFSSFNLLFFSSFLLITSRAAFDSFTAVSFQCLKAYSSCDLLYDVLRHLIYCLNFLIVSYFAKAYHLSLFINMCTFMLNLGGFNYSLYLS